MNRFLTRNSLVLMMSLLLMTQELLAFPQNISMKMGTVTLREALAAISRQTSVDFYYSNDELDVNRKVDANISEMPVERAVEKLVGNSFSVKKIENGALIISPKAASITSAKTALQQSVNGIVKDAKGIPVPSVTVKIEGKNSFAITDANGKFSMKAAIGDVLVFTSIGFETRKITLNQSADLEIILQEGTNALGQVVVTGYKEVERRKLTSSVVTIDRESLITQNPTSIDKMLQGQVPGMSVVMSSGEPGSVPNIKIRGTATLTGNTAPLWVIDGVILENPVPLTPAELNTPDLSSRIGNAITGLNPDDIQSITILKDASATAIYGVKAAGGVVVLTTKRGKAGKPVINFRSSLTVMDRPSYNRFNVMNSYDRIAIEDYYFQRGDTYFNAEATTNSVGLAGAYARYKNRENATWEDYQNEVRKAQTMNTDWFDELFRNALTSNSSFNISGGGNQTTYYSSFSYLDQKGADKFTDYRRFTGMVALNTQLSKWLKSEFTLNANTGNRGSYAYSLIPGGLTNFARATPRPFDYALNTSRTFPVLNEDGSYYFYKGYNDTYLFNVLNEYNNSDQNTKTNTMSATATFNAQLLPKLKAFSVINYQKSNSLRETYYKENTNQIASIRRSEFGIPAPADSYLPTGGVIFSQTDMQDYAMVRLALEYKPISTAIHEIQLYGGGEYRSNAYRGDYSTGWGYLHDRGRIIASPEAMAPNFSSSPYLVISDYSRKYASYYGVASYTYKNRYTINYNARYDGSNLFGSNPEYRWKPTWSLSGRWNVMEEDFLKDSKVINALALRGSYGIQGSVNEENSPQLIAQFLPPSYWSGLYQLGISQPANPNLRWEKTRNTNIGMDFNMFSGRFFGAVDLYNRKSRSLIISTRISEVNGFSSLPVNFADVNNKGIDVGLSGAFVRNKIFSWTSTVNLSYNKNEVTRINLETNASRLLSAFPYKPDAAIVGKPINSIYSVRYSGLSNTGVAQFLLANGDTTKNTSGLSFGVEDLVYSGPLEAPCTGGFQNAFTYKNFRLNVLFTYSLGGYLRMQPIAQSRMYSPDQNISNELSSAWLYAGDENNTNIPNILTVTGSNSHKDFWNQSDIRVMKSDFLRLSSVSLQYNLPQPFCNKLGVSKAFVQLEGNNLLLITDKRLNGFDPETFSYNSLPNLPSTLLSLNISL